MSTTAMNIEAMETSGSPVMAPLGSISLDSSEVRAMRHRIHELANVFTGMMIAGDLLFRQLETESLRQYGACICDGSARGGALVREIRNQLLAACGELEAAHDGISGDGNAVDATYGQPEIPKSIS